MGKGYNQGSCNHNYIRMEMFRSFYLPSAIFLFFTSFCYSVDIQNQEEALSLRRIAQFYEEKAYDIVFQQGDEFLKEFPKSSYVDDINTLLGDLSVEKKDYGKALFFYEKIVDEKKKLSTFFNKLECLYQTHSYDRLVNLCASFLDNGKETDRKEREKITYILAVSLYEKLKDIKDPKEKQQLAVKSISYFEELVQTDYKMVAKEHLAFLYGLINNNQRASELYIELARLTPSRKEEYLFTSASHQRKYDKNLALTTYAQLTHLEGKLSKEAAYNRLLLLFETQKYSEILLAKDQILKLIPDDKKPLFHFFIGRSYFALEDYKRAKEHLKEFVDQAAPNSTNLELSLLSLVECAEKMVDISLLDETIEKLNSCFPKSKSLANAIFVRGLLHKQEKNYKSAGKDFESIIKNEIPFDDQQALSFEYGHLLILSKNYGRARSFFEKHIKSYPNDPKSALVWNYFLFTSLKEAEQEPLDKTALKMQLKNDLTSILQKKEMLSDGEQAEYLFLLGKTNYALKQYQESITLFKSYLDKYSSYPNTPKAHLFLAYAYKEKENDLNLFCYHAEKALSYGKKFKDQAEIHLSLYNAYYEFSKRQEKLNIDPIEKAAEHLYFLFCLDQKKVSQENQLWLGSYYHDKVKKTPQGELHYLLALRAQKVYENALQEYQNKDFALSSNNMYLEPHFLRLSEIYHIQKKKEKEIEVLSFLNTGYERASDSNLDWSCQDKALFSLASLLKEEGKISLAIPLYEKVAKKQSRSVLAPISSFEAAKLQLNRMENSVADLSDPHVASIITELKNLTIKRSLETEPIHLEAGLELIDIQCKLDKSDNKVQKQLFLLSRMKEDFLSEQDIIGKDYRVLRKKLPQKEKLFQAYLKLIDAKILLCKAKIEDKQELTNEATKLLNELKKEKEYSSYLENRVLKNLEKLEKNLE